MYIYPIFYTASVAPPTKRSNALKPLSDFTHLNFFVRERHLIVYLLVRIFYPIVIQVVERISLILSFLS
jgi:hypothetical protein